MVGTVLNGLSHLADVTSKEDFILGVIRGLGGNLDIESRVQFAKEVFGWAAERPPDLAAPLDCYVDKGMMRSYVMQNYDGSLQRSDLEKGTMIETVSVQRMKDVIRPWVEHMDPFVVVGPEGCGKTMLIKYVRTQLGTAWASTHTPYTIHSGFMMNIRCPSA